MSGILNSTASSLFFLIKNKEFSKIYNIAALDLYLISVLNSAFSILAFSLSSWISTYVAFVSLLPLLFFLDISASLFIVFPFSY